MRTYILPFVNTQFHFVRQVLVDRGQTTVKLAGSGIVSLRNQYYEHVHQEKWKKRKKKPEQDGGKMDSSSNYVYRT